MSLLVGCGGNSVHALCTVAEEASLLGTYVCGAPYILADTYLDFVRELALFWFQQCFESSFPRHLQVQVSKQSSKLDKATLNQKF